jgi:hypothetical protein
VPLKADGCQSGCHFRSWRVAKRILAWAIRTKASRVERFKEILGLQSAYFALKPHHPFARDSFSLLAPSAMG